MDKEKTPVNQEKEAFFEKIKKVPSGDVLVSIFDNHTSDEDVEIETAADKKETRAIAPISSSDSAAMELFYFEDHKLNLLTLTVFKNKDDCLRNNSPEIRVIITVFKKGNEPDVEIADFIGKKKNFNPKNEHDNLLLDIFTETHQLLKIVIGKNQ